MLSIPITGRPSAMNAWQRSAGDRGNLSIFGKTPNQHRLFAEHIVGSEYWVKTEGHGRVVYQWSPKRGGPGNHWFDCLVGCAVAASMCGGSLTGHHVEKAQRSERLRLWDIQKGRQLCKTCTPRRQSTTNAAWNAATVEVSIFASYILGVPGPAGLCAGGNAATGERNKDLGKNYGVINKIF